jgi:flagellar hook assembly protein FlgD
MEINQATYAGYPTTGMPGASSGERIEQQEFLNLLAAQLMHQDPFDPMESSELMNQMVMLQNLESQADLSKSLEALVYESRLGSASNLMGRTVRGFDGRIGVVTGVAITGSSIELVLNGDGANRLPLGNVTDVKLTV